MCYLVDAVAIIVQIHLQQNRTDLALKEVTAARKWAQDSLLVNLAESWVGVRLVRELASQAFVGSAGVLKLADTHNVQGGDRYQQAFYVFEELAQAPSTTSVWSLVSQAVCELHLGRVEEAEAALDQAVKKEPGYVPAIANQLVLAVVSGKDPKEITECVSEPSLLSPARLFFHHLVAKCCY
jgi:coatomer protein complex subunit epsilon